MGTLNNFDPIFFYLTLGKSATGGAFDGVVTPSGVLSLTTCDKASCLIQFVATVYTNVNTETLPNTANLLEGERLSTASA